MRTKPKVCPCGSGDRYTVCCEPLHAGARNAENPAKLMRSRYSAFALGRGEYLVDTLASGHPDLALPRDALARELSAARHRQRFLDLTVLWAGEDEVLFHARVFERGRDLSFAELSSFVREGGRWKYAAGITLEQSRLPRDIQTLDRAAFLALAR